MKRYNKEEWDKMTIKEQADFIRGRRRGLSKSQIRELLGAKK